MRELFLKFWSMESYAIRFLRALGVALGVWLETQTGLPPGVGSGIAIIAALLSGTDETKSGLPGAVPKPPAP